MSDLGDLCGRRAQETADGLLAVLQPLVRSPGGRDRVPGVVVELLQALLHQASATELRNGHSSSPTLEHVREWGSPADAGAAVGLSERRVQQLCAEGHVAFNRVGARGYLVDVDDLRRHLRRGVSS